MSGLDLDRICSDNFGFVFILKISHLLHYCLVTKAIIKSKVSKIEMEMKKLPSAPPSDDVVIVPGI